MRVKPELFLYKYRLSILVILDIYLKHSTCYVNATQTKYNSLNFASNNSKSLEIHRINRSQCTLNLQLKKSELTQQYLSSDDELYLHYTL